MFEIKPVETYHEGALFPGSPGGVIPSKVTALNFSDAKVLGGEINATVSLTDWLSMQANYSYQYVTDLKTGKRLEYAPIHKFNPGLSMEFRQKLMISLFANYVDKTVWDSIEIKPYTMLNSVVSYRTESMEIGISTYNLLNKEHLEHPEGDKIGRSIMLRFLYQI